VATRFLITAKNIDSEQLKSGPGSRIDVALAVLLFLLGARCSIICPTRSSRRSKIAFRSHHQGRILHKACLNGSQRGVTPHVDHF
jgi:hypothetical protein